MYISYPKANNYHRYFLKFAVMPKRIIGSYTQNNSGPLVVVFSQIHGNEPAGRIALEYIFKMLEVEPITNPEFKFKGKIIGLVGNLQASKTGSRFIKKDLNRSWIKEEVDIILKTPKRSLENEDLEIRENIDLIKNEVKKLNPTELIILDLHTTSSSGGIFSIVSNDPRSISIAKELHAPVILGMLSGIYGTTLHYFNTDNMGITTTTVTFESGQHDDPLSINRAIAGIINCLRSVGCVDPQHIENRHDEILVEFSKNLPKVCELVDKFTVKDISKFSLVPGLKNFQMVKKGQLLGKHEDVEIVIQEDSILLMPLYQNQGEDGFFLIKEASI